MNDLTKSKALYEEYKKYVLTVTPFREPILESADGNYYTDVDGNKYLDMMAGQFCEVLGHGDAELADIVGEQMKKITHTNTLCLTEEVMLGAKALASLTADHLNKTILLSTGAEAVECALRYAKFHMQRNGIVALENGYHGLTLATQAISSGGLYAAPQVDGTHLIPTPDWHYLPEGKTKDEFIDDCLEETRKRLEDHKGEIAAFIIEPIVSVGGMIYPPERYFTGLKEIIDDHGALLIYDECQTGLGRLGTWFGYEHTGTEPDILVLAKAAGLGLATSAVVFSDEIAESVEGRHIHFSSHQNDPVSGVTLKFLIDTIQKDNLLEHVLEVGAYALEKLETLSETYPAIRNPRGVGLMIGFDLPFDAFTEERNPGKELINFMEENGVMTQAIRRGATFRIIPSYTITKEDIDFYIEKLELGLKHINL